jgi:hypothetical protein
MEDTWEPHRKTVVCNCRCHRMLRRHLLRGETLPYPSWDSQSLCSSPLRTS